MLNHTTDRPATQAWPRDRGPGDPRQDGDPATPKGQRPKGTFTRADTGKTRVILKARHTPVFRKRVKR